MGCARAQTKLPAANGVLYATEFSLREKRCCPAGKLHFGHPERSRTAEQREAQPSGISKCDAGRIFGEIMHQKVRLCIKLQKLLKTGFCTAFTVGNFEAKTGVKTVKIGSWARLFTTRIKVHLISTKNRHRASKSHKNAVFVPFSAIFLPIYAPKNTLFPPQQIIVIHCEYPQTPCAPMGLSLA